MKTLSATTLALFAFGCAAFSQQRTEITTTTVTPAGARQAPAAETGVVAEPPPLAEYYQMVTGSVVAKRGRDTAQLSAEVRLSDGSILTPGGTVRRTDGTINRLAEGQVVTSGGKIGAAPATTGVESNAIDKTPDKTRAISPQ